MRPQGLIGTVLFGVLLAGGASALASDENTAGAVYVVGPGDVLEIRVLGRPELNTEVRVDGAGKVRVPMIDGDIQAGCRTEGQVADDLVKRYQEYLKDPQVTVAVKEYSSQVVNVVGAVNRPGSFQLKRRVRLRELVALAGGVSPVASDVIQLARETQRSACAEGAGADLTSDGAADPGIMTISAKGLFSADNAADPYVLPGDFIVVQEARQAWVVGNVYKPSPIPLNETVTLTRAIAMAGGALPSSRNKVRILREQGSGRITVMEFGLDSIEKSKVENPILAPGDIVEVRTSFTKSMAKQTLSSIASVGAIYYPLVLLQ